MIIAKAVDSSGNIITLDDSGTLEKNTPTPSLLWSTDASIQVSPGVFVFPNNIAIDHSDDVWVVYDAQEKTRVFLSSSGVEDTSITDSEADVLVVVSKGEFVILYNSELSKAMKVRVSDRNIEFTYEFDVLFTNFDKPAHKMSQIASTLLDLTYIAGMEDGKLVLLEIDHNTNSVTSHQISTENPPVLVSSDTSGRVWIVDIAGMIFKWDEVSRTIEGIFSTITPGLSGFPTSLTFDSSSDLVLVDDGSFSNKGRRTQTIDSGDGTVSSFSDDMEVGPLRGDPAGFQLENIVFSDVVLPPVVPVVDTNLITVTVTPSGLVSITGFPGSLKDADTLQIKRGVTVEATPVIHPDNSFSFRSGAGFGTPSGGEVFDFKAFNTSENTDVTASKSSSVRDLGIFSSGFITGTEIVAGVSTRIKIGLNDNFGVPITASTSPSSSDFILRIKKDDTGFFWNGNSFVPSDGDFLPMSFDVGNQSFSEVTIPSSELGQITAFIDEPEFGPTFSSIDGFIVSDRDHSIIDSKIDQILQDTASLESDPSSTWNSSVSLLGGSSTVGGFISSKLDRMLGAIQSISSSGLSRKITVDGLFASISPLDVVEGTTPTITAVISDPDNGNVVDLNGATVRFVAGRFPSGSPILVDKQGVLTSEQSAGNGVVTFSLTDTDTSQPGEYLAEIIANLPGGRVLKATGILFSISESLS